MSARVPFTGFVGSAFRTRVFKFDSQDLWNWFLERADSPGAKQTQALLPCPGFQRFVKLPTDPVRGLIAVNNRLFAVGGSFLYEVSRQGAITARTMTMLATPTTPIITNNPLAKPIAAPKAPVVTHGGAVGSTTYGYRVTATNEFGETEGSDQGVSNYGNATLSATNWNIVSWSYVEGAQGYKVYQTYPIPKLIAVVSSTTLVVHDIGQQGTAGNPPGTNTTGAQAGTTTYGYQVAALIGLGTTAASPEGVTTSGQKSLNSTNYNIITWARVPNARGYKVYRTTGNLNTPDGGFLAPPRLIATITDTDPTSSETLVFEDRGMGLPNWEGEAEMPPGANTTGGTPMVDDGMPVSFSTSGDAGHQMLIVSGGSAYCYDLETDVFAPVLEGATFGGYIDSYFVALDAATSTLKVSESLDGFRWDPTQLYQRSRAGDKWLSMAVTSNEIWLIGSQTGEVWRGTGQDDARFVPFTSVFIEIGIIAASSLVRIGGTLMWLAQDKDGAGFIVRTNGYTPQHVSTVPVDWHIQNLSTIADAFAFTYQQEGHLFYVLTFPSDDVTWVTDFTTGEWHKRGYWNPNAMRFTAYRPQCHAFAFGGIGFGRNLVGDRLTGVIAEMHPDFGYDLDGSVIRRVRQTPHVSIQDQEVTFDRLQVDLDVGLAPQTVGASPDGYAEVVMADGPISYYRLGETNGTITYDATASTRTATIEGGVTLGTAGPVSDGNAAMTFNGVNGKVTSQSITLPVRFSIEAWVKSTYMGQIQSIWSSVEEGSIFGVYFATTWGYPMVYTGDASHQSMTATGPVVCDGNWHHVVVTCDGTNAAYYVDGVQAGGLFLQPHTASGGVFYLGHSPGWIPSFWQGELDEVATYPTVLTAAQVAKHFAARTLGAPPKTYADYVIGDGAVSYYRLGELTGAIAHDTKEPTRTATMTGGVTLGVPGPVADGNPAMGFDGTGYLTSSPLILPPAFSIEAWVRTTAPASSGKAIWCNIDVGNTRGVWMGIWSGGTVAGQTVAAFYSHVWGLGGGKTNISDGNWHHIVWTHDGSKIAIYVDGLLDLGQWPAPHPETVNDIFYIGLNPSAGPSTPTQQWDGTLDEIAVYPTALTAGQIVAHFGARKVAPWAPGLDPTMMLVYSNDGRRWGKELWRSAGRVGETAIQVAWSRLGTSSHGKTRVFRLVVSDPVPWRLVGAWLELEGS